MLAVAAIVPPQRNERANILGAPSGMTAATAACRNTCSCRLALTMKSTKIPRHKFKRVRMLSTWQNRDPSMTTSHPEPSNCCRHRRSRCVTRSTRMPPACALPCGGISLRSSKNIQPDSDPGLTQKLLMRLNRMGIRCPLLIVPVGSITVIKERRRPHRVS